MPVYQQYFVTYILFLNVSPLCIFSTSRAIEKKYIPHKWSVSWNEKSDSLTIFLGIDPRLPPYKSVTLNRYLCPFWGFETTQKQCYHTAMTERPLQVQASTFPAAGQCLLGSSPCLPAADCGQKWSFSGPCSGVPLVRGPSSKTIVLGC